MVRKIGRREKKGKLSLNKGSLCPFCGHHKSFNSFGDSGYFNKKKCSRCKKWF